MSLTHYTKQQALDQLDVFQKEKQAIFGIEVLRLHNGELETSMYKTVWFTSQRGVYRAARSFLWMQMAGEWKLAEFKILEQR